MRFLRDLFNPFYPLKVCADSVSSDHIDLVSYVNGIFEPKNSRLSFTNRRNKIGLNTDPSRKPACVAL